MDTNNIDIIYIERAKANLFYQLTQEDSTHYDLIKSFEEIVMAYKWCPLEEFREGLEEYKFLIP